MLRFDLVLTLFAITTFLAMAHESTTNTPYQEALKICGLTVWRVDDAAYHDDELIGKFFVLTCIQGGVFEKGAQIELFVSSGHDFYPVYDQLSPGEKIAFVVLGKSFNSRERTQNPSDFLLPFYVDLEGKNL